MKGYQKTLLLLTLFIIPINLYKINFDLGSGIQFALIKFQDTIYSTNFFTIIQEFSVVTSHQISGRSALGIVIWILGSVFLLTVIISDLYENFFNDRDPRRQKSQAALILLSVPLYLGSCMAQYGPTLSGPAGYCIPIGLPLLVVTGWWLWKDADTPPEFDEYKSDENKDRPFSLE